MQTIIAILMYLGLIQSPKTATTNTAQTAYTPNVSVNGTPVIIDIQEF